MSRIIAGRNLLLLGGCCSIVCTSAFTSILIRPSNHRTVTTLYEQLQSSSISQPSFGFASTHPDEAISSTTRPTSLSAATFDMFMEEMPLIDTNSMTDNVQRKKVSESLKSIISASLLITSNTVGAGCLVLPELTLKGPGMMATTGIFFTTYLVNLISGLIIAQVAIYQKEQSGKDSPSSFKEFARVNLNSDVAAHLVSSLSLFVNACVLSFDLSRVGVIGSTVLHNDYITPDAVSCIWAAAILGLISTQSSRKLSEISSFLVTALFVSFGGLLVPGLANVADPLATMMTPGQESDFFGSVGYTAPIILMAMVFQNIVPTVTKLLNYDRFNTVASLVLGSSIPLVLYLGWIFACVGGGIDTSAVLGGLAPGENMSAAGVLLTIFSLVTIGGSTLCGSMSVSEELDTYIRKEMDDFENNEKHTVSTEVAPAFHTSSAFVALAVPLFAAIAFASEAQGQGLTNALALAGSIGSPLLYGAIPAFMAYRQLKHQQETDSNPNVDFPRLPMKVSPMLVPSACLPVMGALSVGYVCQEMTQSVLSIFT